MPRLPDPELEQRILDAASRLWARGGEKALTMRAVAKAAGTTTPTVYERYRDRDDILRSLRQQTRAELFIALSRARNLRQTVEGAEQARRRGAHCVAITDTHLSPLNRICHETFLAGIESNSYGASYAAPIALIHAILAAIGQHRQPKTLAIVKEISEEQRRGSRWYHA